MTICWETMPRAGWDEYLSARERFLVQLRTSPRSRRRKVITSAIADAWNARDPKAVASLYAPNGARHEIAYPGQRLEGRIAIAAGVGAVFNAWPDCTLETRRQDRGADGLVILEWVFRGTQENDYGALPGTGGSLELPGVSLFTMRGELVAEERVYWDTATLMASAGVLPDGATVQSAQ
jgi:steroid delta-isomerase-like uncharacterized protein